VRIPLDYYRILGLPIQATAEQLEQAHRDRTLQMPRREYSEVAIESRKQLIDQAYAILSDPNQRQRYDNQFLSENTPGWESATRATGSSPETDTYSPTVEIDNPQLAGALLILLELGEYELVIRLGRPYLSSGTASLESGQPGNLPVILPDVVLSLALACLELGREQWQQHQYENAAESLDTGRELLMRENLFPSLRSEIQSDLYKLRPYRILELVARPLDEKADRQKGISLLKSMLQARGGIDGAEDDLSGLGVEDFLRFIQQLRGYLTSAEQQEIFETEAQRASAVGTYLAVYAFLARGFAKHQPALVRQAKQWLMRLGGRQDIHLEQAVCAVLLGQTEEASRALDLSRERDPILFIQEHSQGSPDLLPGLCLYAERWLQQEVFPFFRDLDRQSATLKDYFADEQVQTYLETMPPDEVSATHAAWSSEDAWAYSAAPAAGSRPGGMGATTLTGLANPGNPTVESPSQVTDEWLESTQFGTAGQVAKLSPEGRLKPRTQELNQNGVVAPGTDSAQTEAKLVRSPRSRRTARRSSPKWDRLSLVLLLGLLCVGALGFVTMRLAGWLGGLFSGPRLQGDPLTLEVTQPVIELPAGEFQNSADEQDVNAIATTAIETWFAAKAAALGANHNTEQLQSILSEPALSRWLRQARESEVNGWNAEYKHSLKIDAVEPDDPTADALTVRATVSETANFYQNGILDGNASYDEVLDMQYELIREGDQWLIKSFEPVE
jgi:hypothetical protein